MTDILLPEAREALFRRLIAMYAPYFGHIAASGAHLEQMARDNADEERSIAQLEGLVAAIGRPLTGMNFLEVGSGIGLTVAAARKLMGAEAYGIEPGDAEYEGTLQLSRAVLAEAGLDPEIVRNAVGEAIPFPDNYFNVVYSSNVLEHVKEPPKVISEIIRALKPGGHAQIVVPNYGSWWEGHYGVIWFPHLPATLGKIYVRLLGREPSFIDTLQLVTRGKLERWLAPHKESIEIIDWGVEIWERRVRSLGFSEYSALGRLKGILRLLHTLKIIPLLILIGKFLHWETPLILTFKKKRRQQMPDTGKHRSGRKLLIWIAQGAITLVLIAWLVNRIDYSTIETVKAVSIPTFLIAVLVYSLSQFCCAARLRILVSISEKLQGLPSFAYLLKLTLSTFFISNFLPGTIGGDVVKAFALTRRAMPLGRAVSTLLLDRLTNMAAAVGLSVVTIGIAAPDLLARLHISPLLPLTLILLFCGAIAALAFLERFSNLFAHIGKVLREIALSWLRSPLILVAALFLSIASLLCAIGAQWILASGLNVPVNPLQLTAVICLVYLVTLAPITLNGIGLQEVSTVVLLEQLGTHESVAISFALLTRLMIMTLSIFGAAVTVMDRKLYADMRQSTVRSSRSRFLELLQESPLRKRLMEFLPFAREPRPRR